MSVLPHYSQYKNTCALDSVFFSMAKRKTANGRLRQEAHPPEQSPPERGFKGLCIVVHSLFSQACCFIYICFSNCSLQSIRNFFSFG